RVRHVGQAWLFNLICLHLKAARTRAAAHMSLHRQSQFQRSNQTINRTAFHPSKFSFEKPCYPSMLATGQCSVAAAPRPVKTPLSGSVRTVNRFFSLLLRLSQKIPPLQKHNILTSRQLQRFQHHFPEQPTVLMIFDYLRGSTRPLSLNGTEYVRLQPKTP
ncbi:hypothetical protein, partial [Sphingopyxis yananensis]|uniref:hypothetical protein n=1 Tax=Sphingopyxis yananensis TaxID=2886687 RepID=UPI001D10958C